jgi:rhodanese-related sulfurtransferase
LKLVTEVVIVVVLSGVIGTAYHTQRDPKTKIPLIGKHKCNFDRSKAATETTPNASGTSDGATPAATPETITPSTDTGTTPVVIDEPSTPTADPVVPPEIAEPPAVEEELGEFEISVQAAFEDYFQDGLAIFVDARRGKHFEPGHIPGARSLSPWEGDHDERLEAFMNAEAESGRPVVIYCTGGDCEDSHAVGERLREAGFQEVMILRAGFPGWKKAGHPVETGPEKTDE